MVAGLLLHLTFRLLWYLFINPEAPGLLRFAYIAALVLAPGAAGLLLGGFVGWAGQKGKSRRRVMASLCAGTGALIAFATYLRMRYYSPGTETIDSTVDIVKMVYYFLSLELVAIAAARGQLSETPFCESCNLYMTESTRKTSYTPGTEERLITSAHARAFCSLFDVSEFGQNLGESYLLVQF